MSFSSKTFWNTGFRLPVISSFSIDTHLREPEPSSEFTIFGPFSLLKSNPLLSYNLGIRSASLRETCRFVLIEQGLAVNFSIAVEGKATYYDYFFRDHVVRQTPFQMFF